MDNNIIKSDEENLKNNLKGVIRKTIEENVSIKVVKIIQSYTGIVDKMVWRKG